MIITRRRALSTMLAASGGAMLPPARAGAEPEFVLKCGTTLSGEHPLSRGITRAADRVRTSTGGRVDIRVFPSSQLGSQTDMISQVRSGGLEMAAVSCVVLSSLSQPAGMSGIAFAFDDYADAWRTMDGPLGASVRRSIEKAGLTVLDKVWDGGFFHMMSGSRPIRSSTDLKGFKLRVPPAKLWVSMYQSMDASPTAMSWGEVYTSLQTRIVDGVDSALINFADAKLYEVQKYASLTRHIWDGFWMLGNRRAFARLPGDARDAIAAAFDAEASRQRAEMAKAEKDMIAVLEGRGMKVETPDRAELAAALKRTTYYGEWRSKFGDEEWKTLVDATGKAI